MILAAEAADAGGAARASPGANDAGSGAAAAGRQPTAALLRRPKVFTLTIVWESPQVREPAALPFSRRVVGAQPD